MLDVPCCPEQRRQREVRSQSEHRRAGLVCATGCDLLFDLHRVETSQRKWLTIIRSLSTLKNARRAVAFVRAAAGRSSPRTEPFTRQAMIPPDRFRYGRVNDAVTRKLESGGSPLVKLSIRHCRLEIADCQFDSVDSVFKLKIGNRQLAIT